jgi:hypothetical protein
MVREKKGLDNDRGSLSAKPVDQHVELSHVEPIEVRELDARLGSVPGVAPLPDDSPTLAVEHPG